MANADWIMIFRSFTTEELAAKRTELISQMSVFASQSIGSKSFSKDLRELRDQLASLTFVQKERSLPTGTNPSIGVTDFSGVQMTGGLIPPQTLI